MRSGSAAERAYFGMNTEITCRIFGESAEWASGCAGAELTRMERKLSRFLPGSEISRMNDAAGKAPVCVSKETYDVLSAAVRLSGITQGLFDITVSPLVDLWDYKHSSDAPEEEKIRRILPNVNYRDLILDPDGQMAGLRKRGQSADLGGIGKGFAGDRCMKLLRECGISSACINLGGNVCTLGNKPGGSPWSIGIRHPRKEGCLFGAVEVAGMAVVTSGDYERYFIDRGGKRRHHILNPFTGYPAESGLVSVTVIAESAMTADALSTAIFAAGLEKGLGYLESCPGCEAVLVDRHLRGFITPGLKKRFISAEGIHTVIL